MAGLHFDITGDNSQLAAILDDTEARIRRCAEAADSLGKSFDLSSLADGGEALYGQLVQVHEALSQVGKEGDDSGQKITQALGIVIDNYSSFEGILKKVIAGILSQAAATAKDTAQKTVNTAATTAQAAATKSATVAQIGLNAAMAANPVGLILTAVGALLPLLESLISKTEEEVSILDEYREATGDQIAKLSTYSHLLRTSADNSTTHKEALEGLNKMAKQYNVTLLSENSTLEEQRRKYLELTEAIKAAAAAKILASHTEEAYANQLAIQDAAMERVASKLNKMERRRSAWTDTDPTTFWQGIQANSETMVQAILGATPEQAAVEIEKAVNTIMGSYEAASGESLSKQFRSKMRKQVREYVTTLVDASRDTQETVDRVQNTLSTIFQESSEVLIGPVESFGVLYDKARAAYEDAVNKLAAIEADRANHTLEEYNRAKALVESTKSAFKDLGGDPKADARDAQKSAREAERNRQAALKANEQELALQRKREDLSDSIARSREKAETRASELAISAMKSGFAKQQAELQAEHDKRVAAIRKNYLDMIDRIEALQLEEYKSQNGGSSRGFVFDNADPLVRKALGAATIELDAENADYDEQLDRLERKRQESRTQYLRQYGDYKEKVLAITEEYDRKISETEDEWLQKSYEQQKAAELDDLAKEYSAAYALIFSDVDALSKTMLARAIDATQAEIQKAKDKGDIQALTDLYKRLRDQMDRRDEKWGFSGLASAFSDLSKARRDMEEAVASGNAEAQNRALIDQASALSRIEKAGQQVTDTFTGIGDSLEGFGGNLGKIGSAIKEIASGSGEVVAAFSNIGKEVDSAMRASAISTGISATASILGMIGRSITSNKAAQEEWNKTISQTAHELAMLKLAALDYKQQNIFGVENPYKRAIDGATQYAAAIGEINDMIALLNEGQVQTGTKKAVDWKAIAKGAIEGAGAGAAIGGVAGGGVFSWATAAIGAAIGGLTGAAAGLFSQKTVPVFESLLSKYGWLYNDQTYELNPEILAAYSQLNDTTKQIVDNWGEIRDKALEAQEQMRQNFSDLAGDIGQTLNDSLVAAIRSGDIDAASDDFKAKLTSKIEDIVASMTFSSAFSSMFDDLEKEMIASFGVGGDRNIVDDIMRFNESYGEGLKEYQEQMDAAIEYLRQAGYDVFTPDEQQRSAAKRASLGASQDSIDESNGRLTAIQGHTYEINENVRRLAASAGFIPGEMQEGQSAPAFQQDYAPAIAEIKLALQMQGQQLESLGETVGGMNDNMDGVLKSVRQMEDYAKFSKENSARIKSSLDEAVERGIPMR